MVVSRYGSGVRHAAIILSGLLLTTACGPATEEVTAVAEASGAPDANSDFAGPRAPEPPEVFPVPAGTPCSVRGGWSEDADPAGLNVRAEPSPTARIVGKLPPRRYVAEFDREMSTSFDIEETRNGWFRISNPYAPDTEDYGKPSTLPSGWISGRYVGFALQSDIAFAAPDPQSQVIATSWHSPNGIRQFGYRQPMECRGKWVRLLVTDMRGREREAWARGVCNSQETTCDGGAEGDYFDNDSKLPTGP